MAEESTLNPNNGEGGSEMGDRREELLSRTQHWMQSEGNNASRGENIISVTEDVLLSVFECWAENG